MKLYDLPRGSVFQLIDTPQQPPDVMKLPEILTTYTLHNIDGMYSYVTDGAGNVYHFAAWTEVKEAW